MRALFGTLGLIVGVFIGVVADERLFAGAPEWTSAITPILFAFGGWALSRMLFDRLGVLRRTRPRRAA
jgi:hypothetical protein